MNELVCSSQVLVWALWITSAVFVFLVEALKSYLVHFRYRELREDVTEEKRVLSHLFSIVENKAVYRRTIGATLLSMVIACFGACWITLGNCFIQRYSAGAGGIQLSLLWIAALVGFVVFHGVFFKWLPVVLGPKASPTLIRIATLLVVVVAFLYRPFRYASDGGIKLFEILGIRELPEPEPMDRDFQILAVGREDVMLTHVTEKIASRALELSSISVYDILLPRNQVQVFDFNETVEENLRIARKTGHTRFPLCDGDLDNCSGLIHIKDIFRTRKSIGEIDFEKFARPIMRIGQLEPLDKVLQVLLQKRVHMALVEDEFGGVLGVVTLERILEELVGEIQDEFDKEDKMIVQLKKDFYKISGLTPLHEMEDQLGIDDLEHDDVSSFGGLITHHLGRIPDKGERLEIGRLMITVGETDETRVITSNVRVLSATETDDEI